MNNKNIKSVAEEDPITREWRIVRGSKVIINNLTRKQAEGLIRTLQANDDWVKKRVAVSDYARRRG